MTARRENRATRDEVRATGAASWRLLRGIQGGSMKHFLVVFFIAVSAIGLLLPGSAMSANVLPAKWGIQGEIGPGCTFQRMGGFKTCPEAAAEFDRLHKQCNPADMLQTHFSTCGTTGSDYLHMFYMTAFGSPNSKGQVKSYCDDWNDNSRFNLFVVPPYSPALGAHCGTAPYSMRRNAGMPDYCPNCMKGNPVNPANGNKFQIEPDYAAQGPFAVQFTRYYNSLLADDAGGRLGANWTHTYSRKLVFSTHLANPVIVGAVREDGKE